MATPGLRVNPIKTLDQGADINEVFLDDVEVPVENLVGEEDRGWTIAKFLLGNERANIAGIGMCKRLLSRVKALAANETRRGRPLARGPALSREGGSSRDPGAVARVVPDADDLAASNPAAT